MNNSDDISKEGRTFEDEEETRRNLVGFFQLLLDIDRRLKRKESSPPNIPSSSAPTNLQSSKNLTETITVRLDPKALQRIRAMAQQKGVGPTTLIRIWMMEGLKENPMG